MDKLHKGIVRKQNKRQQYNDYVIEQQSNGMAALPFKEWVASESKVASK